ncbi:MAG: hypothetical protein JJU00_15050 [Opitutales bacterium]|nr:hypothetical protein [Opitutales bacterium]
MFRRLILEEWQNLLLILGFLLIACAFFAIVVKTVRMKRKDREYMANLPLEDEEKRRSAESGETTSSNTSDEQSR